MVAAVLAAGMLAAGAIASLRSVPVWFAWPTSVDVVSKRSLLVVANGTGKVMRLDPVTGKTTRLFRVARAYAVVHAPQGGFYLSDGGALLRVDAYGHATTLVTSADDIGPIAVAPNGDVYFATTTSVFKLGSTTPLATGLSGPHGLALTRDGGLLVSDTGNGRVDRIDLVTKEIETWATLREPRGITIAPGNTVYVVGAGVHRIVVFMIDGRRLGTVGKRFLDPYALKAAPDGSLYVIDTAPFGLLYHIAHGKTTVVSR
jgi:DNA-binding beta-propeller fold protein YncE